MKGWMFVAALVVTVQAAAAAAPIVVVQQGRTFHPDEITIQRGQTIDFANRDEFLHQIYVFKGNLEYDSKEQAPGETLSITFPEPGDNEIRCHIHPTMQLTVHVK